MLIFPAIVILTFGVANAASVPLAVGRERYAELREFAVNRCYDKLLDAPANGTAPLLQLAIPLSEMCGCIGDMTATAFLPLSMPDLRKIDDAKSPEEQKMIEELYKSVATICTQKLRPQSD